MLKLSGRNTFKKSLSQSERRLLARLTTPFRIQAFLDDLAYNPEENWYRSPLSVMRDRLAHCFEGAVFAAAAFTELGHPPLIVNMFPEPGTDDEHLLAVFRQRGAWGAVAKSNYTGLRYREPIYRTLRELVVSYFELYYNLAKQKTLRTYTRPLNLKSFDRYQWNSCDETMNRIHNRLDLMHQTPLLTRSMIASLSLVDARTYQSGLSGANPAGLFAEHKHKSISPAP